MQKEFKDLPVGVEFVSNGTKLVKIPDEKVSCCRTLNAENVETKEKVMVLPMEVVETQE
jgi:hypothetical protein